MLRISNFYPMRRACNIYLISLVGILFTCSSVGVAAVKSKKQNAAPNQNRTLSSINFQNQPQTKDIEFLNQGLGTIPKQLESEYNQKVFQSLEENSKQKIHRGVALISIAMYCAKSKFCINAIPGLFTQALAEWPNFPESAEAPKIWKSLRTFLPDQSEKNESILTALAETLFSNSILNNSDDLFVYLTAKKMHERGQYADALKLAQKIAPNQALYRRAKYLEGLCYLQLNSLEKAREAFRLVVQSDEFKDESASSELSSRMARLRESAVLNLARLSYEAGEFLESIGYYRSIESDSPYFFDSLNEQIWAFFLAGLPNRALGAQYAVASPFYKNRFNPEAYFLRSILFYWLCDYDRSINEVKGFIQHARLEGDQLMASLNSWNSQPEKQTLLNYAKIYDETAKRISARNIGLGPKTLTELLRRDSNKKVYDILVETQQLRLQLPVTFAGLKGTVFIETLAKAYENFELTQQLALGRRVKSVLVSLGSDYKKALEQTQMLYLEVLTAKKDTLLGKSRAGEPDQFKGTEVPFDDFKANQAMSWKQNKAEYWFDELGHYVFQYPTKCESNGK